MHTSSLKNKPCTIDNLASCVSTFRWRRGICQAAASSLTRKLLGDHPTTYCQAFLHSLPGFLTPSNNLAPAAEAEAPIADLIVNRDMFSTFCFSEKRIRPRRERQAGWEEVFMGSRATTYVLHVGMYSTCAPELGDWPVALPLYKMKPQSSIPQEPNTPTTVYHAIAVPCHFTFPSVSPHIENGGIPPPPKEPLASGNL